MEYSRSLNLRIADTLEGSYNNVCCRDVQGVHDHHPPVTAIKVKSIKGSSTQARFGGMEQWNGIMEQWNGGQVYMQARRQLFRTGTAIA